MPESQREIRDRIEQVLADEYQTQPMAWRHIDLSQPSDRRVVAGLLRKAYRAELARLAEAEATIARVRAACRQHRDDGYMPVREVLDALYGEDRESAEEALTRRAMANYAATGPNGWAIPHPLIREAAEAQRQEAPDA